jgi:hypothetical protein
MFNSMFKGKSKLEIDDDNVDYTATATAKAIPVNEADELEEQDDASIALNKEKEERYKAHAAEKALRLEALELKRSKAPYVVLSAQNEGLLADKVNDYILKGYHPWGDIIFAITKNNNSSGYVDGNYVQAVYNGTKETNLEKK